MLHFDPTEPKALPNDSNGNIVTFFSPTCRYSLNAAQAVAASAAGILSAVTDNGAEQVFTSFNAAFNASGMPSLRNVTVTFAGTAGDIGDGTEVVVEGLNGAGEAISETFASTENTANTVTGVFAFWKITKITIGAHDGTGATTAVGWGSVIGLPFLQNGNRVLQANFGGVPESTAPTVIADNDELHKNTAVLNSALDGSTVDLFLLVS